MGVGSGNLAEVYAEKVTAQILNHNLSSQCPHYFNFLFSYFNNNLLIIWFLSLFAL